MSGHRRRRVIDVGAQFCEQAQSLRAGKSQVVLSTLRHDDARGLTAFRHTGPIHGDAVHAARATWIGTFARAVVMAGAQATMLPRLVDQGAPKLARRGQNLSP